MSRVITTDLAELTSGGFQVASMGLKPSGSIHLGTAMTFLQGMMVLSNNPSASLEVNVMDLDFDHQRGRDFVPYQSKTDPEECHRSMSDHTIEESQQALTEMAGHFGVSPDKIKVSLFGDITNHPQFQDYLVHLFGSDKKRQFLKETIAGNNRKSTSLLAPICGSCAHSSTVPPVYKGPKKALRLRARCFNEKCRVERYQVGLTEPRRVNFFYLVDPIRDLIPDDRGRTVDVHLFGGSYGWEYGEERIPKAKRVLSLMSALSDQAPQIYVGPVLISGGTKLGKSLQSSFTVRSLRESHSNWVERLHSMLTDHPRERTLDMSAMERYLN